uniref:LEM domain-containing protein n=1 Tax=Setaria digitata TaxID=48799 RepID=A0A915PXC1_9BILA
MPTLAKNFSSTRRSSRSPGRKLQKPVHTLSDEELRASLIALGANVGPITATTRTIYEKQLEKRLQNSSSGILSHSSDDLTYVHNARKYPTPPRPTMVPRFRPSYSVSSSSSYAAKSLNNHDDISEGTFSSSSYQKIQRRLDFKDSREELSNSKRRVVDEYDGESDDDHMESSRIVTPNPAQVADTKKPFSVLSVFNKYLKLWGSFILPRKSISKPTKPSHLFSGEYSYSFREATPSRSSVLGFDISRVLLFSLVSLFGFLLIAYLATANSGALIQSSRIAYFAAKDTVFFFYTYAVLPLLASAVVCGVVIGIYMLRLYQTKKKAEDKRLTFDLIEKITDIIRDANEQGQVYVAEPHVRDMLLPPSQRLALFSSFSNLYFLYMQYFQYRRCEFISFDRMRDSPEWRRWQEAVKFINLNESRVSTETRIVNGVECSVWRWIPAKKNGWQGSAFDGSMRRNMLDHAPSHCLKLRGLFSSAKDHEARCLDLKEALLQKIAPVKPLHVHLEKDSKEGVMFARFASLSDCSCAFKSLHGTWFNGTGQLVWAKFLRDERYEQRFPNAPRQ